MRGNLLKKLLQRNTKNMQKKYPEEILYILRRINLTLLCINLRNQSLTGDPKEG